MNEKFFDLKKEKQNRMINAGLRIFSLNGYRHASTDEIVKEARISKGLLFHYFGSKAGYYAFLYDYISRFTILELTSEIRDPSIDYFELEEKILTVESRLMDQYPFIFLFLESIKLEDDGEGLSVLSEPSKNVFDYYEEILDQADISGYIRLRDTREISALLHYVKIGIMRELLRDRGIPVSDYTRKIRSHLNVLKHLARNL